jgi:hypothetical protein
MLLIGLLLAYAFIVSFTSGQLVLLILKRVLSLTTNKQLDVLLSSIVGLAALSVFIAVYHFFFAISWPLHALVLILLSVGGYCYSNPVKLAYQTLFQLVKNNWLLLTIVFVACVFNVLLRPGVGDISDYHLQAIKWAEKYRNVLGLGNFNRPLANNNWWFNLQAYFGLSFIKTETVYVLNALMFFNALFYFINSAENKLKLFRIPIILFLILSIKTAFIGAVTPDYIITILVFICFDLYQQSVKNKTQELPYLMLLQVILICWAITIKMIALVMILLPLAVMIPYLFNHKTEAKKLMLTVMAIGVLYIVPWVIGNVIACGYLMYPVDAIDLFDVDWKVPASYFEYDRLVLKSWGKIPWNDIYDTAKYSFSEWFPIWFKNFDAFNKGLFVLSACSLLLLLARSVLYKREVIWPMAVALIGFTVLFMNGPHARFLYGYAVTIIALLCYTYSYHTLINQLKYVYVLLVLVLTGLTMFKVGTENKFSLLNRKPYPKDEVNAQQLGPYQIMLSDNDHKCWDQFPCSAYFIEDIELRGSTIDEGFRVVTTP